MSKGGIVLLLTKIRDMSTTFQDRQKGFSGPSRSPRAFKYIDKQHLLWNAEYFEIYLSMYFSKCYTLVPQVFYCLFQTPHSSSLLVNSSTIEDFDFPGLLKALKINWKKSTTACFFTCESSYCFQCVLAIAILSVCPSVTRVDQSKTVQASITKSSPSAAWKILEEP